MPVSRNGQLRLQVGVRDGQLQLHLFGHPKLPHIIIQKVFLPRRAHISGACAWHSKNKGWQRRQRIVAMIVAPAGFLSSRMHIVRTVYVGWASDFQRCGESRGKAASRQRARKTPTDTYGQMCTSHLRAHGPQISGPAVEAAAAQAG